MRGMGLRQLVLLGGLIGVVLLAGCDASLDPFGDESGFYSVYGFLATGEETNYVRVRDLTTPPVTDSMRTLNATVTLENLASGRTETLTDSIVRFEGTYTHNFRVDQDIRPNTTYQLTVEGNGGKTTRARAKTPPVTEANVSPERGAKCAGSIQIGFPQIAKPRFIDLALGMRYGGKTRFVPVEISGRGGAYLLFLFKPAVLVEEVVHKEKLPFVDCDPTRYCRLLDDRKVRLAYTHYGPDLQPDSLRSDPFSSPVENGVGTFLGLRRDTLIAVLDTELRCPGAETVPCRPVEPPELSECPDIGDL